MEPQHSRYVLNSGKDNIPFLFIVMFNNIDNHHQTNNSSLMATLIHETDRMSSLEIAELTGKRHDNIVRDIRSLLKQGVSHLNFEESSYKQPQPRGGYKELPCFELTKKGCLILASGYDAVLREKIIDRWEQLELEKRKPQTPQTYLEALKALVSSEEEKQRLAQEKQQLEVKAEQQQATIELQEKEIKQAAPKVNYYDTHLQSVNTLTTTQVAKEIGMNAEKLNSKLKELGIQYKQSGQWLLKAPYDRWGMHDVRTNIFTSERGNTHTNTYTVWTQRGRRFIIALYENDWDVKKAIKQIKGEMNSAA